MSDKCLEYLNIAERLIIGTDDERSACPCFHCDKSVCEILKNIQFARKAYQRDQQRIEKLIEDCKYFLDCFDTTVDGLDLKRIYRLRTSVKGTLTAYEQMKEKE